MEKHIDSAQVVGGNIDFLPVKSVPHGISAQHLFRFQQQRPGTAGGVYQDAIFDTKKKALPGVEVPKRAKNKGFPQIFGLLEALFLY
jgi:hypothetical protein